MTTLKDTSELKLLRIKVETLLAQNTELMEENKTLKLYFADWCEKASKASPADPYDRIYRAEDGALVRIVRPGEL